MSQEFGSCSPGQVCLKVSLEGLVKMSAGVVISSEGLPGVGGSTPKVVHSRAVGWEHPQFLAKWVSPEGCLSAPTMCLLASLRMNGPAHRVRRKLHYFL